MENRLEQRIEINNEEYDQIRIVSIAVNELKIRHILSSTDGERNVELIGTAEFLNFERLEIVSNDGSRSRSQSQLNLTIRKSENEGGLKNSALLNIKDYVGDIESIEDYGLDECVNTGFSHLTYYENIYDYDKKINCVLILADDVYEILLEQVKTKSISNMILGINYFNIFIKLKTEDNKKAYEFGKEEENIYILAKDNDGELSATTFGYIEIFLLDTHKNLMSKKLTK